MLITKTPFRISFCGGGSDIEDFYKEYAKHFDKQIYVYINSSLF